MSARTEEMPVEYVLTCSCGRGQRLELTEREQRDGDLNQSTQIIANLFEYFHTQHGTVEGGFALVEPAEPTPVLPTPAMLDAKRAVDEYKGEK